MAQKVNIILVDDLDGGDADQTVAFGLDGTDYEIDLSDANADALREALANYVGHGRKITGGRGKSSKKAAASSSNTDKTAVREWAKANGYEVSERGRIPVDVQDAYDNRDKGSKGQESAPKAEDKPKGNSRRRTATVGEDGKVAAAS